MIRIADISYWQQNIDYDKFSKDIDGVILRGAYGVWADTMFDTHYREFRKRGIPVGIYHYIVEFRTAREQAKTLSDVISKSIEVSDLGNGYGEVTAGFELGIWNDVEIQANSERLTRSTVLAYHNRLEELIGFEVGVYTSRHMWDSIMGSDDLKTRKLWIAHYGAVSPLLPATGGWSKWWLWQKTSQGRVDGYPSDVDINDFWGLEADYNEWVGRDVAEPKPLEPLYEIEVTANALNVRSSPVYFADGRNIVTTLENGDKREVYRVENGWLRVGEGWISSNYVIKVEDEIKEPTDSDKLERLWDAHPELH